MVEYKLKGRWCGGGGRLRGLVGRLRGLEGGRRVEADLHVLYRLLCAVAAAKGMITYGDLSAQYEQQTGDPINPHQGWNLPLAEIDRRCVGLCHGDHRPILSAIVVSQEGMPGGGFWGIEDDDGVLVTPAVPDDAAWVQMVASVHAQEWPQELDGLPT